MKVTVIVPTIGRPSLSLTLKSIKEAGIDSFDEVLVVGSGEGAGREAFDNSGLPGRYLWTMPTHGWGGAQRNLAFSFATGQLLAFLDDDDLMLPGALRTLKSKSVLDAINIFKIQHRILGFIWNEKVIRPENFSTQSFVIPNIPSRLPIWPVEIQCDFKFISVAVKLWPQVVWHEEVITVHNGVKC